MALYIFISILVASNLQIILAQYENFAFGLRNDLDASCVKEKGYTVESASKIAGACVFEGYFALEKRKYEFDDFDQALLDFACKDKIAEMCVKKLRDVVIPCLPEEAIENVNIMTNADLKGAKTFCENDGENFKLLMHDTCYARGSSFMKVAQCEQTMQSDLGTNHLKDFFTEERCEKYEKYYECLNKAFNQCPDIKKSYGGLYKATYEAIPCSKNEVH